MPGLRSWASGGFSHFVLDEELDHKALKALQDKDVDVIASLPLSVCNRGPRRSGTGSPPRGQCSI